MKFFSDDYYTVVAENKEQVIQFFVSQELTDEEGLKEIREINHAGRRMIFPLDELPEEYHDETKYPRQNWCGEYIGVSIPYQEAVKYRKKELPYILCVSNDIV